MTDRQRLALLHHTGTARARGDRWGEARHGTPWPDDAEVQVRTLVVGLVDDAEVEVALVREALEHARAAHARGPVRAGGVSFHAGGHPPGTKTGA